MEHEKIRVIQYGIGAIGINIVRLLLSKPNVHLVGAIDHDRLKIGRDLGDVVGLGKTLGLTIKFPPEKALNQTAADVVIHATTAFMDQALPQIMEVLDRRINTITIAQELFFPLGENVEKARQIDKKSKEAGVSVIAVGINPGFIMDAVPVLCSLPCWEIEKVSVRRVVDFSPYGPDEMTHIGAGLSPQQFLDGVKKGVIGHIGLLETAAMVARCLGICLDELKQKKEPIVTRRRRESSFISIQPGKVCGFRQIVAGFREENELLNFELIGIVSPDPEEDGVELGDHARIDGTPSVDITIKEEIAQKGGLATAGVAVNMIPIVINSAPGFHTMDTWSLPHIWSDPPPKSHLIKITDF